MSDFLHSLLTRALSPEPTIQPRIPAPFEWISGVGEQPLSASPVTPGRHSDSSGIGAAVSREGSFREGQQQHDVTPVRLQNARDVESNDAADSKTSDIVHAPTDRPLATTQGQNSHVHHERPAPNSDDATLRDAEKAGPSAPVVLLPHHVTAHVPAAADETATPDLFKPNSGIELPTIPDRSVLPMSPPIINPHAQQRPEASVRPVLSSMPMHGQRLTHRAPDFDQFSRTEEPAPAIQVTIGRVEVRAVMPPPPAAQQARPRPRLSLEDYLQRPIHRR